MIDHVTYPIRVHRTALEISRREHPALTEFLERTGRIEVIDQEGKLEVNND